MKNRSFRVPGFIAVIAILGMLAPISAIAADNDVAAIRQVLLQQQANWNRGDVDAFMHGYKDSPDTTFVTGEVRKGYRTILTNYQKRYANKAQMGQLTFSDLDVRLLPASNGEVRYASVTGHFHLKRTEHGAAPQDDGVFSLLWQKTADGWKIILDHTS